MLATFLDSRAKLAHTSAQSLQPLAFWSGNLPTEREPWLCLNPSRFIPAKYRVHWIAILCTRRPPACPVTFLENPDEGAVLSSLKELIAAGNHGLDPILGTITDVARQMTGASGAALAMWKEGAMVCRARSGHIAPVLGTQLSAKTGISGECLRTGKIQHCADTENDPHVDLDVCRSLGLRSIAVLPIRGWRGVNGILEVFSTRPAAFTEPHI